MKLLYEKNFFIHTSFVDRYDYIRPFAIWELFQAVAGNHADSIGVGFNDVVKKSVLWVVQFEKFNIVGSIPKYADTVKVQTWPHKKERIEFVREYAIYNEKNELAITGISSWFLVNKDTHKITRGDEVEFNGEFYENTNYPNYKREKLNLVPNSDIKRFTYQIKLTDLDHNGHTNNAKYFDMVYNLGITKCSDIKGGAISFIREALLDEIIYIDYFKNSDNNDCYKGYNKNNEAVFEILLEVI